jgi:hypothetical protein
MDLRNSSNVERVMQHSRKRKHYHQGRCLSQSSLVRDKQSPCSQHCATKHLIILLSRLPRRGENHSTQLHPLITARQEDRSHPKRLVLSLNTPSQPQPPPSQTHDSNNPSSLQNSVTQPTSKSPSPSPKTASKSKNGSPSPTAASAVPSRTPGSRRSSR